MPDLILEMQRPRHKDPHLVLLPHRAHQAKRQNPLATFPRQSTLTGRPRLDNCANSARQGYTQPSPPHSGEIRSPRPTSFNWSGSGPSNMGLIHRHAKMRMREAGGQKKIVSCG
ncbi:hypothetical protein N657DRAFT_148774 [Parathielavia appendiculata]|uniref:Uncharacterized protein n=1 Tax=Parathielavia appendiculata TaxID=2587402 RepID=A0AAN6TTS6_9PEZI|nr:hypothetical protein N657DRAFT_148774 [Parathielavia appendiculata]